MVQSKHGKEHMVYGIFCVTHRYITVYKHKDHPRVLGLKARILDLYVYVVCGASFFMSGHVGRLVA